jgi:PAS domain-containing protein
MERELWKLLYRLAKRLDKGWGCWLYSVADISAAYFWALVHDRPETVELLLRVDEQLRALMAIAAVWVRVIDGKPLGVSSVSKNPDAQFGFHAGGWENFRERAYTDFLGLGSDERQRKGNGPPFDRCDVRQRLLVGR